jgi:hypothetical protein
VTSCAPVDMTETWQLWPLSGTSGVCDLIWVAQHDSQAAAAPANISPVSADMHAGQPDAIDQQPQHQLYKSEVATGARHASLALSLATQYAVGACEGSTCTHTISPHDPHAQVPTCIAGSLYGSTLHSRSLHGGFLTFQFLPAALLSHAQHAARAEQALGA